MRLKLIFLVLFTQGCVIHDVSDASVQSGGIRDASVQSRGISDADVQSIGISEAITQSRDISDASVQLSAIHDASVQLQSNNIIDAKLYDSNDSVKVSDANIHEHLRKRSDDINATKCRVPPLTEKIKMRTTAILSAYVQSFYLHSSGDPFAGKIRVKRVFKGEKGLEGRQVIVEGLGDPNICSSTPRLGDTALFFLEKLVSGRFQLQSSIRRLNLSNLKVVWNIGKNSNRTDCKTACSYGGTCHLERCVCRLRCKRRFLPVCGKDGITYRSKCDLKRRECSMQTRIPVLHHGKCKLRLKPRKKDSTLVNLLETRKNQEPFPSNRLHQTRISSFRKDKEPNSSNRRHQTRMSSSVTRNPYSILDDRSSNTRYQAGFIIHRPDLKVWTPQNTNLTSGSSGRSRTCSRGYWRGQAGCRPCSCWRPGSVGEDCDEVTGQCSCRLGYAGHTCDVCQGGSDACREAREIGFMADRLPSQPDLGVLGSFCKSDDDCNSINSVCKSSVCTCQSGFVEDSPSSCRWNPPGPCSDSPCQGGGTCEEHDGMFTCYCSENRSGKYCEKEKETEDSEAAFSGSSFVTLGSLPNSVTRTTLELEFKPYTSNGIIFIARQSPTEHGDYLSISLKNRYIVLKYDLGSGSVTLTSNQRVRIGSWNKLSIKRYRQDSKMRLNGQEPVTARTGGRNKSLNLRGHIYIGGLPNQKKKHIRSISAVSENFKGCIRGFTVQGDKIDFSTLLHPLVINAHDVTSCAKHPCSRQICHNGGRCAMKGNLPRCICPRGFHGKRCKRKRKRRKGKHGQPAKRIRFQVPSIGSDLELKKFKYNI